MVNSKHWELLRIGHQSKDWELVKILEILREMASFREPNDKAKELLDRAVVLVDGEENHTTRQMRCNFRDNHGHSLLMIAAQLGDKGHIAKLREHGGHVSLKDTHNRNAFHFLGLRGKKDAEETADILHILAGPAEDYCPQVSMLRDPVPVEVSLDAPTHNGTRPLHLAASSGTTALAQRMPVLRADPNAEDGIGQTPIFKAVQNGHAHVVQALIEQEASLEHKDKSGRTPIHFATDRPDVQKVLHRAQSYGFGPFHPNERLENYYPSLQKSFPSAPFRGVANPTSGTTSLM
jgi:ankyrin repeat protein